MAYDDTPDGVLPFAPVGSLPVTETVKLVDVVCAGKALTVLVGGVVSISQEVDSEPLPGLPFSSWMPAALTVNVYSPLLLVSPVRPLI